MSNKWLRKENPFKRVKYKEQLSVLVKKNIWHCYALFYVYIQWLFKKNGIFNSFIFTAGSEHTLSWIRILVLLPV